MLLSIPSIDTVDVVPIRLYPPMLSDLDDGVTIIEDAEGSDKSGEGFNDQSG
jgi:hypothetical protein